MRKFYPFQVNDIETFRLQLLALSDEVKHFCYLDSNHYSNYPYSTFGSFFAIDAIEVLSAKEHCLEQMHNFQKTHQDWMFGFLNYDLKNEIEPLAERQKHDFLQYPLLHFFIPKFLIKIENNKVEIGVQEQHQINEFDQLLSAVSLDNTLKTTAAIFLKNRTSKIEYLNIIEKIKNHIQQGDIYEMNYCMEFYAENTIIHPAQVFSKLNQLSKAPFTSFFKNDNNFLLCASPERFLKRQQNNLISQPIKGTRRRTNIEDIDQALKLELFNNEKERSENVMIVDLVRNDFSKIAIQQSVNVEELFGIYSFEQVHQMISTISCAIPSACTFADIINATFPMGSMTGAPKIAAMKLIEQYEPMKRSLYSGAVGYISPKGNFDFNVVIRSILYNRSHQYVSVQAGSAITIESDAENEYEECLLKANAMLLALEAR
jgi:para-aminobenzoate synthetase component 1